MINYFGYGANRDANRLAMILGHEVMGDRGALLQDYVLGYQLLGEIPEPAQKILKEVWGEDFRCYSLKPQLQASVVGRLWVLTETDLDILKEWEFVGTWKNWIEVKVNLADGSSQKAYTEMIKLKYPLHGLVDGLYYQDQINDRQPLRVKVDPAAATGELNRIRRQLEAMKQYRFRLKFTS